MRKIAILAVVTLGFHSGCGTLQLSPITNETRTVQAVTDGTKAVTVTGGMVWYDASPVTHGLRFPPGIYTLEAEDSDYLYLRSPVPLEFRVFNDGKVVDSRDIPGGLMIGKHFSVVPAAGYIDGEGTSKVMVWKLGQSFLRLEGTNWTKTF